MIKLINKYQKICMTGDKRLGKTSIVKHGIYLENEQPIAQKFYKENDEKKRIISEEIEKMEKDGIIRDSYSPWSSPVVLVGKKNGKKRFCINYIKLNSATKSDAYPLPRIDDLLEKFRTARWFTTIDLANGYWQIEMEEKDKEKTAFICEQGLYEFNVMPFGLKNAPAHFKD